MDSDREGGLNRHDEEDDDNHFHNSRNVMSQSPGNHKGDKFQKREVKRTKVKHHLGIRS